MTTKLYQVLAICLGALAGYSATARADDITDGATTFHTCAACHSLELGKTKVGPSLHGLFGRKAGTLPGFSYTEAMKNSGFTWGEATLTTYLHAPREVVPGTRMAFGGIKDDAKVRALIEYLKSATQ